MDLKKQHCVPCEGGVSPLTPAEAEKLLAEISGWALSPDARSLTKVYRFKNFSDALIWVNKIGALAESEGHHPDIALSWGKVGVILTTHAIKGLSVNDFILASKIDDL